MKSDFKQLRILHVIPYYKPAYVHGGPIYSSSALCEQLVKNGHKVTVLTTTANGDEELAIEASVNQVIDGVEVIYFKRLTKNNTFLAPKLIGYLYRHIREYDIVHIHTWWNLVSVLSLTVCSLRKVRPVLSPRGMLSDYIITTKHGFQKKVIHQIYCGMLSKVKFHVTADAEFGEVRKLFPEADVRTIFNFVAIPDLQVQNSTLYSGCLKLLFLSRIDPKKGLELLFKALSQINWLYELTIAGPSDPKYLEQLKAYAVECGISDKIHWIGPVYGEAKYKLIAEHDIMTLTSYNENFANIVIECLSMGTAVLISEMVGLSSYVKDNELGWICTNAPNNIAYVLNQLHNERSKLKVIREKAPTKIKEDFDSKRLVDEYISWYKRI